MVSRGMLCIKYLVFCFNLLFAISGIAILTVGAILYASYFKYSEFVDPTYDTVPLILIVVGVIVFIVAFFGCCGASRESHCMIITFSVFLLIIFSIELAAGIAGYLRRTDVETMLESRLNATMFDYNSKTEISKSWDILQHELSCCGMKGPKDWQQVFKNDSLPHTCCKDLQKQGSCTTSTTIGLNDKGCLFELKNVFVNYATILGGVGIGIALIQLTGVIFACCLARSIRREYETV